MTAPKKRIGILGTGMVGRAHAARLAGLGHEVMIGTKDVKAKLAETKQDMMGNPPFAEWKTGYPAIRLGSFAETAVFGELIINATHGAGSLNALKMAGEKNLAGKTLVDISNELDFSQGMPPRCLATDADSLGERIQRAFPRAKVVKTLNTVNAILQVEPAKLNGGDHSIFMSGDAPEAKAAVAELLREYGWKDVIDLGDLSSARGAEMLLPIWLRLWGTLKIPAFNFKIVR